MKRLATSALALGVLGAGCGPAEGPRFGLEGSLSVLMDLRYDAAHLVVTLDDLALRFAAKRGEGEDIKLKVTASVRDLELVANGTIDLAESTPAGNQRGVISRDVLDDPRRLFPRLQRGRIILDQVPSVGSTTRGELSLTFENGLELASGRTVFGDFEADVL